MRRSVRRSRPKRSKNPFGSKVALAIGGAALAGLLWWLFARKEEVQTPARMTSAPISPKGPMLISDVV